MRIKKNNKIPEVSELSEHDAALYDAMFEGKKQTTSPIPIFPQLSVALGILVFVFSVTYIGTSPKITEKINSDDFRIEASVPQTPPIKQVPNDSFANTSLIAHSAFVWDVQEQKILYNKNGDAKLPLASITKLMTALVTYELIDPDERIYISPDSLKTEGESGFTDGEEFSMQDLNDLTLISSSNDGAVALSIEAARAASSKNPEQVFVTAMNLKAKELGLTHTSFQNATGLDIDEKTAGAHGSARDVALLMEHIILEQPETVALTTLSSARISNNDGSYHLINNTNESVNDIQGLIASKTGFTDLAGGNLVVAFNAGLNRPVIVVVLGSSQDGRFTDTLDLIERTRKSLITSTE